MLKIEKLKIYIDGKSDTLNNGETAEREAMPESKIKLEIKVKNLYDEDVDEDISDINDIEVTATVNDIEEDHDLELESDQFDLSAQDTETITFEFNVPLQVEEDTYAIDIKVKGEDGLNVEHEVFWTVYFKVDKKSHEIRITNVEITPNEFKCTRKGKLEFSLINLGTRNEDEVIVTVQNSALGLNYKKENIELDKDPFSDDNIYDISVPLNLENVKAGTYEVIIKVYLDENDYVEGDYSSYKKVDVVVKECKTSEEQEEEEPEEPIVIIPQPTPTPQTNVSGAIKTEEVSFTETNAYLALLVLANLVVLLILIAVIGKFIILMKK